MGALGYAPDGQGSAAVSLVVVDTVAYAAMLADTPLAFEPTARGGAVDGRAPVLVSRSVDLAGGLDTVAIDDVTVPVRVVGTDAALTRLWGVKALPVVVIPREAASGLDATLGTNTALAQADSSMATAVLAAPPALLTGVTDRRAVARERATSAFPAFIGRLDLVGAIIGAALTALGLWLLVGIGRTARRDTVLLMRTLGLPERDQRRLEWLDVVPVVVVGGLAGIGLGLLLPRLLERVVDLRPFTGALVRTGIPPSLPAAAVVLAALAVLTILALTVDALGTRRAELTDHLRVGERR